MLHYQFIILYSFIAATDQEVVEEREGREREREREEKPRAGQDHQSLRICGADYVRTRTDSNLGVLQAAMDRD